ncbi:MAG TPA: hypothetical protein ENN41_02625 [Sediminispirochaeta sp.]|nr:hypothetical protein [Sediminispirochaeta sp.]
MIRAYAALLLMVLMNTLGQILVKKGAVQLDLHLGWKKFLKSLYTPYLIGGVLAVVLGPLLYMYALTEVELNVAYSFSGLTYLSVVISGHLLLHERITYYHIAGSLAILAGLTVWNIA